MPSMDSAHALVIGIAKYQSLDIAPLPKTVTKDAKDIYSLLINPNICAYPPDNTKLLLDGDATQAAIRQELQTLTQKTNEYSIVFFYISSHGGRINLGESAASYLLPVDTGELSEASLNRTAISGDEFTEALSKIPARKAVVVFDCCHAADIGQLKGAEASPFQKGLPESYYQTLQSGRGRAILASSRGTEFSTVIPGAENSLFTQHLLAGLQGGALGSGGVIRILDLFNYLQPKVVADHPGQHPILKVEIEENFPIALYLGGKAPMLAPAQPLEDGYAYDVFISYRQQQPDKDWVRRTLKPKLEEQGLKVCIDYRDFRLGAPLVKEMERAVIESRYTLAVVSPAYFISNYTDLENVMAQHLGLEKSQHRLITLLREDCTPRLGMRSSIMLDMTYEEEFDTNMARLIDQLRQPPDA